MSTNALFPRLWFLANCHDCEKWFRFETAAERDSFARTHQHSHIAVADIDADKHPHYGQIETGGKHA